MPPFVHTLPVRFADVDHAGIVYYPTFLHYFHVCFEEFFRARLGARAYVELLDRRRVGFPSVQASCEFLAPLAFGDEVDIEMRVERLGQKSVTFAYELWRRPRPGDRERVLAARGQNTAAVVDLDEFRAVEIPEDVRALIGELR